MVVPSIFIAATTFGAINNAFGLSNETFPYYNILTDIALFFIHFIYRLLQF